ncbi:MAG: hypothetical protein KBD12_00240 [Candidatus Pacebacteria bacterium]|nr:hypothetical protein [Candidatus Paceibacterota bacterium]
MKKGMFFVIIGEFLMTLIIFIDFYFLENLILGFFVKCKTVIKVQKDYKNQLLNTVLSHRNEDPDSDLSLFLKRAFHACHERFFILKI